MIHRAPGRRLLGTRKRYQFFMRIQRRFHARHLSTNADSTRVARSSTDRMRILCRSNAVATPENSCIIGITSVLHSRHAHRARRYFGSRFLALRLSDEGSARMACRARILPDRAPHALAVITHPLAQSGASSFPHLLAHGSQRKASDILVVHQAKDLPDGSLRQIVIPGSDEPLLTTSPELTFVHMAPC
ncbi:MAG: hypothetical protein ACLSVD_04540 [Eggerthellaceae bacterium]